MRSSRTSRPRSFAVLATGLVALVAACAPSDSASTTAASSAASSAAASSPAASSSAAASGSADASASAGTSPGTGGIDGCGKDTLATKAKGTLTIGTDKPAYSPWFADDDPTNGKGYESAVAYAVAAKLGYTKTDVKWTVAAFSSVIAPGPKTFDFAINQFSITDERKKNVDFSSGYYDVTQSVVTVKGSKAAGAKTIADLAKLKLGAQVGTTSYTAINEVIKPASKAAVFNTNDDAKLALANGTIDAIVVDLPTGLFLSAVGSKDGGIDNGVLLGQLPQAAGAKPEQFGLALDKGSTLTSCVSKAVDALRTDGTLKSLETQWLTSSAGAPVLS